jgi:glycerol uptake facilitator protein
VRADLGRRLLAEFVGTALPVIFGAGAIVAALEIGHGQLDYAGLAIVALSFALVIDAAVHMFGTTSGAHNFVARLAGALVGAVPINAIFGSRANDLNVCGGTVVGAWFTRAQAAVAEELGTFLLLATIMALPWTGALRPASRVS